MEAAMQSETFLRRDKAAEYLKSRYGAYTTETLAKLACIGGGPKFRKLGRFPVYTPSDLDSWAQSRMSPPVSSTAELAA
jgi:hypothetical protein